MAAQEPQTSQESADEQEEQIQTSDDKLAADLYKDYSPQNKFAQQLILIGSVLGIKEVKGIRDAYAFFAKNQIDTEKLIKDPVYRAQIKQHVNRLNFWEKGAIKNGRSKLGTVLDGANKAITEVDSTNKKLVTMKEGLIKDYSTELQNLYGLSKDEIDAIIQRVKYAVQKDPSLSMQDLMQQEGQVIARKRLEKEVKKENLSPEQKEEKVKTKLSEIEEKFSQRTVVAGGFEENSHFELTYNCKQKLDQVIIQPSAVSPPQPSPTPAPQPIAMPPPPVAPPPVMPSAPISLPPSGLTQGLGSMFGGLGKMFGGLGSGLKSILGRGGAFSKAFDTATRLGKMAINRGLDALLPGLGAAVGKINDVIKSIIGIDVEGTIVKGAVILVGAVAAIVIIVPIIIGVGVFSYITGNNPLKISYSNEKTIGWNEFNKQYLSIETNSDKLLWQQFSMENLTVDKKYLSLDPNRHDDVKK